MKWLKKLFVWVAVGPVERLYQNPPCSKDGCDEPQAGLSAWCRKHGAEILNKMDEPQPWEEDMLAKMTPEERDRYELERACRNDIAKLDIMSKCKL